jgi:hypothetical protein
MSIYSDASLIFYPSGYEAGILECLKPTDGTGNLTFTRASTATRVNESGLIESVATGVPRIDYTGGGCGKLLLEPQRANVVLHSGDLSQTVWAKSLYALSSTSAIQGLTATRITKNATNNGNYAGTGSRNLINTIGTFASGIKTLSWLIRKGNTDKVAFLINNVLVGALTNVSCEFNFNTQTFTNVALGLTASFENPETDVYKIILTINDTGASTGKAIWIAPIDASNNTVDGGYLDFAFAQWELGSSPTSYTPTTTTAVTRVADAASKTGISSLIGQTEGTLYANVKFNSLGSGDSWLTISSGTNANWIFIGKASNKIRAYVKGNGIVVLDNQVTNITSGQLMKIAIAYKTSDIALYINGSLIATSTNSLTFSAALSLLALDSSSGTSENISETTEFQEILIFPTRKSNAELATLTTL